MHAVDLQDRVETTERDFALQGPLSRSISTHLTEDAGGLSREAIDLLHRSWFSIAGECSEQGQTRPLIPFGEVLEHIEDAFDLEALPTDELRLAAIGRIAENLEDVMLAIACLDGRSGDWTRLENEIAPLLARMCELRVDETDALLHAARFLRAVRDRTRRRTEAIETGIVSDFGIEVAFEDACEDATEDATEDDGTPCLQDYAGLHPLRSFLGGPLFAMLQDLIRDGLVVATGRVENRLPANRRLRLAD